MTINLKEILRKSRELIGSLLFPPRCLVCDEILEPEEKDNGIHFACVNKLYFVQGAVCMHCGRPLGDNYPEDFQKEYCNDCIRKKYDRHSFVKQGKALLLYKGAVKESMYRFKYGNRREYAEFFSEKAIEEYGEWLRQIGAEAIIPVPLHVKRQCKRGYNQAEVFARRLSDKTGIPIEAKLIRRVRNTAPQKVLNDLQRKNNLKNAFHIEKNVVQYKCVVVVDDIYTTGSTAQAVAQEMIKRGTHRVYLFTICIGGDM